MKVFIIGLRRSGTTAFWRSFRNDPRLVCFDEPFSPELMRLPLDHPKRIWGEYIERFDPADFWGRYTSIGPEQELEPSLTESQRAYLEWLLGQHRDVVVDLTRCSLKLADLAALDGECMFIHLHRSPQGFASSHMIPSRSDAIGRLRQVKARHDFWDRTTDYDGWGMERLYSNSPASKFGVMLEAAGFDVERCYQLPAVGRLLVLWLYFFNQINQQLADTSANAISIRFDEFSSHPKANMTDLYRRAGFDVKKVPAQDHIQLSPPGNKPDSPRWNEVWESVMAASPDSYLEQL